MNENIPKWRQMAGAITKSRLIEVAETYSAGFNVEIKWPDTHKVQMDNG